MITDENLVYVGVQTTPLVRTPFFNKVAEMS
jgi:hypothetical protein